MIYTIVNKEESDELYHYGILGMKWGIRRFQPYLHGKHGREVGEAAKVKTRRSSFAAKYRDKLRTKTRNAAAEEKLAKANTQSNKAKLDEYKSKQALKNTKSMNREQKRRAKEEAKIAKEVNKASLKKAKELSKPEKESKKEAEYRDKLTNAIESGNARKVAKYKAGMSDEQIQRAIDRIRLENNLDYVSNQQKELKFATVQRIAGYANTAANLTTSAVNIYNNIAGASNALRGTDFKLISTSSGKNSRRRDGDDDSPDDDRPRRRRDRDDSSSDSNESSDSRRERNDSESSTRNQNGSRNRDDSSSDSGSRRSRRERDDSSSDSGSRRSRRERNRDRDDDSSTRESRGSYDSDSGHHTVTPSSGTSSTLGRYSSISRSVLSRPMSDRESASNLWAQSVSQHRDTASDGVDTYHDRQSTFVRNSPEHDYNYRRTHTETPRSGTTTPQSSSSSSSTISGTARRAQENLDALRETTRRQSDALSNVDNALDRMNDILNRRL